MSRSGRTIAAHRAAGKGWTDTEVKWLDAHAQHYVDTARRYQNQLQPQQ